MGETNWIQILGYATLGLATIYLVLSIIYQRGWIFTGSATDHETPETRVSIVVAARNEQDNMDSLLQSLTGQNYPEELLEIIIVDDHSTDHTVKRAQKHKHPGLKVLRLPEGLKGKKAALQYGIERVGGEWIMTTDADCTVSPNWVAATIAHGEENDLNMVLGQLAYRNGPGLLNTLQQLELAGLMCITGGSLRVFIPHMAHGANLAYKRELFNQIGGFEGLHHSPSGDDVMLLLKASKQGLQKAMFLISRQTVVLTGAAPTWADFWQQRLRWAGKSANMGDRRISAIMFVIYLFNLVLVLQTLAALFTWHPLVWTFTAGGWGLKLLADLNMMAPPLWFIGRVQKLLWLPVCEPVYTFFMAAAGPFALFSKVKWKGREW